MHMHDTTRLLPRPRRPGQAIIALGLLLILYVLQSKLLREPDLGFVEIDTALNIRQVLEVLAIAAIAGYAFWRLPRLGLRANVTVLLFLAFAFWTGLSAAWSFGPGLTALRAVEFAAATLLILSLLDAYDHPVDGMLVLSWMWMAAAVTTLIGSVALWSPDNVYEATRSTIDGFVAAFVIGALLARRRPAAQTLFALAALLAVLLFYRSIGTLVAAGVVFALALAIAFSEAFVGRRPAAVGAGILLLISAILLAAPLAGPALDVIGGLFDRELNSLRSLTGRTDIWAIVIPKLLADPQLLLVGGGHVAGDRIMVFDWVRDSVHATLDAGEHDFGLAQHTHNLVLGAIANVGVVGLVLLSALYFVVPVAVLTMRGQARKLSFLTVCLTFILVNGISENILSHANLLATGTLAFILAATRRSARQRADGRRRGPLLQARATPPMHQPAPQ